MYHESLIATGGAAPIIRSRAIPPELPAANDNTRTPKRSSRCLTPAVAPLSAKTKVPPRSKAIRSVVTSIWPNWTAALLLLRNRSRPELSGRGKSHEPGRAAGAAVPDAGDGDGRDSRLSDRASLRAERGAEGRVGGVPRADAAARPDRARAVREARHGPRDGDAGARGRPPHRRVAGEGDGDGARGR